MDSAGGEIERVECSERRCRAAERGRALRPDRVPRGAKPHEARHGAQRGGERVTRLGADPRAGDVQRREVAPR